MENVNLRNFMDGHKKSQHVPYVVVLLCSKVL